MAVILGINIPLLLVVEFTSKAAEAAGVLVPIPTCAKAFVAISIAPVINAILPIFVLFLLLKIILQR